MHHKNRVRSITWKPLKLYSRNLIQISISMRWRAECKDGNSALLEFLSYFPLNFVHHKNRVRSITWKPLKLYSQNFIQISISIRWLADRSITWKPLKLYSQNFIQISISIRCFADRSITWKPLKLYSQNFIQISTSMRWRAENNNGNSAFYTFWVIFPWTLCITKIVSAL